MARFYLTVISFSDRKVAAAKLPKQGQEYDAGDPAVVSGWGTLSSGGQSSDVLMKVEVPIVSDLGESFTIVGVLNMSKIKSGKDP